MTQDLTNKQLALDAILTMLVGELELALDVATDIRAQNRFGELLTRCINATGLAKAGQTINARPGEI
jgi:hypothetical protein